MTIAPTVDLHQTTILKIVMWGCRRCVVDTMGARLDLYNSDPNPKPDSNPDTNPKPDPNFKGEWSGWTTTAQT